MELGSGHSHAHTNSHGTKYKEIAVPKNSTIRTMRLALFLLILFEASVMFEEVDADGAVW